MRTDSVPVRTGLHHPFSPQDKIMRWRLWSVHHTRGHPHVTAYGRKILRPYKHRSAALQRRDANGVCSTHFTEIYGQNGSKHQHSPLQRHSVHFAEFVRKFSKMVSVGFSFSFIFDHLITNPNPRDSGNSR